MNVQRITRAFAAAAILGFAAASAVGSLATDPYAYDDGSGPDSGKWRGTAAFSAFLGMQLPLAVDVEYCVYGPSGNPGVDPSPFEDSWGFADPSGGSEFVYAYQIFNDLNPHPFTMGAAALTRFSITLHEDENPSNWGSFDTIPGEPPTGGGFVPPSAPPPPNTVGWDFNDPNDTSTWLDYGEVSDVLIYTSPYPAEMGPAAVQGGGYSDNENVPNPIPEPASLALCAVAGALVLRRRRRRIN